MAERKKDIKMSSSKRFNLELLKRGTKKCWVLWDSFDKAPSKDHCKKLIDNDFCRERYIEFRLTRVTTEVFFIYDGLEVS